MLVQVATDNRCRGVSDCTSKHRKSIVAVLVSAPNLPISAVTVVLVTEAATKDCSELIDPAHAVAKNDDGAC